MICHSNFLQLSIKKKQMFKLWLFVSIIDTGILAYEQTQDRPKESVVMNRKKQNKVLFTVCLGFFMVILDATIVNVALPSIARGFNSNTSDLQWIMVGYTLSFASLLLLAGRPYRCKTNLNSRPHWILDHLTCLWPCTQYTDPDALSHTARGQCYRTHSCLLKPYQCHLSRCQTTC